MQEPHGKVRKGYTVMAAVRPCGSIFCQTVDKDLIAQLTDKEQLLMVPVKNSVAGTGSRVKGQLRYKGKILLTVKHHHFIQQQAGNHHIVAVK